MVEDSPNKHIELELKIKIPDQESYFRILDEFGDKFLLIHQRNIYYDTLTGDLSAHKIMFRIRNANNKWSATVKSNASQVDGVQEAIENEIELPNKPTSTNELLEAFSQLENKDLLNGGDLISLGEIVNDRYVYKKLSSELFEIDHTIIAGNDFYEIEVEANNIEEVRKYLKDMFDKLALPFEYSESKYKRFLSFIS